MFQNIKVDIIYYKTNTDFEMEFNLCGCCRMRLLTDKAADRKSLVNNLARAVSRSKVIIIAGVLFGTDGIIETTAKSIGKNLAEIDNDLYGIADNDKISIINGATPLVTSDGYFGGCIIESGPQSMILLSDNKTIRKNIMNTLIHPYIEEICAMNMQNSAKQQTDSIDEEQDNTIAEESSAIPEAVEIPTEPLAESSEETDIDAEQQTETPACDEEAAETAEPDSNSVSDSETYDEYTEVDFEEFLAKNSPDESENIYFTEITDTYDEDYGFYDDDDIDLYIEPERLKKKNVNYYNKKYGYPSDDDTFAENSYVPHESSGIHGFNNLPILIVSIILLIVIAVLCYCIFYIPAKEGISVSAYMQQLFGDFFV